MFCQFEKYQDEMHGSHGIKKMKQVFVQPISYFYSTTRILVPFKSI